MSTFIAVVAWSNLFVLTWVMMRNYMATGVGMSPMVGWFLFLFMALLSSLFNSATKGGDSSES